MIRTSLVPVGVKQANEKKPKIDKTQMDTDGSLAALDDYLREQTMTKKEMDLTGMSQPHSAMPTTTIQIQSLRITVN